MQNFREEDLNLFEKFFTETKNTCIARNSKKINLWAKSGNFKAVRCTECGLIWMNPYCNGIGLTSYYNNYIGKRRTNNEKKMIQRAVQYKLDAQFIEIFFSQGKILDVGCNGGFFLDAMPEKFEKYGIEIDLEAVTYAKEKYSKFRENIHNCSIENAPFSNNFFDAIVMRGTIEHMLDPLNAIKKASYMLKSQGLFFICATPNGKSFSADLYRDQWTLFHPVQHIWHFSRENLKLIAEKFGLQLVAWDYPYLGTPYENVKENIKDVLEAIKLQEKGFQHKMEVSPPYYENMMSLVFQKN